MKGLLWISTLLLLIILHNNNNICMLKYLKHHVGQSCHFNFIFNQNTDIFKTIAPI